MITKITCRYSFEVLDFHCNDFGFTFNIGVSYLGIYKTSMMHTHILVLFINGTVGDVKPRRPLTEYEELQRLIALINICKQ